MVGGRPGLGWPESDRCLVFGQPEWPGEPALVLGTEEPRLGPGVVGGVGVLQLQLGLVLRSRVLRCWPVRFGQLLTGSFGCPNKTSRARSWLRLSVKPSQFDERHRRGDIALYSSCDPTCWWWWCYEGSRLGLPAQHWGAHTHMSNSSAAPTTTTLWFSKFCFLIEWSSGKEKSFTIKNPCVQQPLQCNALLLWNLIMDYLYRCCLVEIMKYICIFVPLYLCTFYLFLTLIGFQYHFPSPWLRKWGSESEYWGKLEWEY